MCNDNKEHVSTFKSLLLACQVCIHICIRQRMKVNIFFGHVAENAGCATDEGASRHGHS